MNLVKVALTGQVRALGADISYGEQGFMEYVSLQIQVPLLNIRPNRACRNRRDTEGEKERVPLWIVGHSNVFISINIQLCPDKTNGGDPSRDSVLASLPFVCSKKMP